MKILLSFLFFVLNVSDVSAEDVEKADQAAKILISLCVSGGNISIRKSENSQNIRLEGNNEEIFYEEKNLTGLVEGINSAISDLAAEQANEARDCMKPYINRILSLMLGEEKGEPDVKKISLVSKYVRFIPANPESIYDFYAIYKYVYSNRGRSDLDCRIILTGVLDRKSDGSVFRTSEEKIYDFTIEAGKTKKLEGKVGIEGFSDEKYNVAINVQRDCW
jgi:hypothetical protein